MVVVLQERFQEKLQTFPVRKRDKQKLV